MCRLALALSVMAPVLLAQAPALTLPQASPAAAVRQTVGLTEIEVSYHRPAVKGRKVWGGLVPFGQVWRAGANENTVVSFSTPVSVGGTTLPAGRYGLHMLPTPTAWTVILSSQSHGWGSYSYDPKEDVARVTVIPVPAEATERLVYTFDDPTDHSVTLFLRWDQLRVPIPFVVDTKAVVVQGLRDQLKGLHQFFPESWSGAAAWCMRSDTNLDEAMVWADRSLAIKPTFAGYRTKAALLEKQGDGKGAEAQRAKGLAIATEVEVNQAGYTLLGQHKVDEAIALFRKNAETHPESWNVYDSLAEAYAIKGNRDQAAAAYRLALARVKADDQRTRIQQELAKLE